MCTIAILIRRRRCARRPRRKSRRALRATRRDHPNDLGAAARRRTSTCCREERGSRCARRSVRRGHESARARSRRRSGCDRAGSRCASCADAADQDAYVRALDPRDYASMNLVWGDARGVHDRVSAPRRRRAARSCGSADGIHVLCNDRLGAPGFPRGDRLRGLIETALAQGDRVGRAVAAARDRARRSRRASRSPTCRRRILPLEIARELTATCIHSRVLRHAQRASLIATRCTVASPRIARAMVRRA